MTKPEFISDIKITLASNFHQTHLAFTRDSTNDPRAFNASKAKTASSLNIDKITEASRQIDPRRV